MVRYERPEGRKPAQEILEEERQKIRDEYEQKYQGLVESNRRLAESNRLLTGSLSKVTQMYERSEARVSKLEEEVYGLKSRLKEVESRPAQTSQTFVYSPSFNFNYSPTINVYSSTSSLEPKGELPPIVAEIHRKGEKARAMFDAWLVDFGRKQEEREQADARYFARIEDQAKTSMDAIVDFGRKQDQAKARLDAWLVEENRQQEQAKARLFTIL